MVIGCDGKIYLYEDGHTTIYDGPPLLIEQPFTITCRRSDGTLLIGPEQGSEEPLIEEARIFDPRTGDLWSPTLVCGYVPSLRGQGRWVVVGSKGNFWLCLTETGDVTDVIPVDWSYMSVLGTSPHAEWVVVTPFCFSNEIYSLGVTQLSSGNRWDEPNNAEPQSE
jgi:hypothetical protein